MPQRAAVLTLAVLASGLASCGGTATPFEAPQGVTVQVSPNPASAFVNGTVNFAAAVLGTLDMSVTWSVAESGGGTVDGSGRYTAPGAPGTFHVVARSVADPTASGSAQVNVALPGTGGYALPPDRVTSWSPGVQGGIPHYTNVHATLAAATGDRASAIQSALNAAGTAAAGDGVGRVVQLGAGVFNVGTELSIPSRVVLRGAGLDASGAFLTQIAFTGSNGNVVRMGQQWYPGAAASTNLTSNGVKGATSVQVASAAGFAAGQLVLLDEITDDVRAIWHPGRHPNDGSGTRAWYCRENRPISQVLEVASVSGNTVGFTRPLHIDFRTAQQAQLTRFNAPVVRLAGVEDLRVSGARGTKANVYFNLAAQCWARHVESDNSVGSSVAWELAHRTELRDSFVRDTGYLEPGGNGYGLDIRRASSDNLIENNIIIRFNKVINGRSSGGGNVIAYNYADDGGMNSNGGWVETGLQVSHYPAPHHELFEGNYAFNGDGEFTEGNAIYITFFRNHLSGKRLGSVPGFNDSGNVRCAGAMTNHLWYNYVGNVLGLAGVNYASWILDDRGPWSGGDKAIWRIGTWDQNYSLNDTQVAATMIRDGNFDYKSGSVAWDGLGGAGSTPTDLPASLYLSGKPAFFGSNPWPWVDPLDPNRVYTLPAKARYDAGRPNG